MESDGTYMSDHQLFFLSDSYPAHHWYSVGAERESIVAVCLLWSMSGILGCQIVSDSNVCRSGIIGITGTKIQPRRIIDYMKRRR